MSQRRTIELPALSLRASVGATSDANREVVVLFATSTPVTRVDYTGVVFDEVLSMNAKHVRLDRLNNGGAPLLGAHRQESLKDVLGVVVENSAIVDTSGGRARVRFSRRPDVEPVWQDVRDGIIRSVSVGYRVHRYEETKAATNGGRATWTAVDWEPFEISLVPIPADPHAGVGRSDVEVTRAEVVSRQTIIDEDHARIRREAIIEERSRYFRERGYSEKEITEWSLRYDWGAA